jgi:hypothetical protein
LGNLGIAGRRVLREDRLIPADLRGSVSFFIYLSHLFHSFLLYFFKGHLSRQLKLLRKHIDIGFRRVGRRDRLLTVVSTFCEIIFIIEIDKVMDSLGRIETEVSGSTVEFYAVHIIDTESCFEFLLLRAVRVDDREVMAVLFPGPVGIDHFLGLVIIQFLYLFLFGFSSGIVDEEDPLFRFAEKFSIGDVAYKLGVIGVIDFSPLSLRTAVYCDLRHDTSPLIKEEAYARQVTQASWKVGTINFPTSIETKILYHI